MRITRIIKSGKEIGLIIVCTVVVGLTACTQNRTNNKQQELKEISDATVSTQQINPDTDVKENNRQGNSNANIVNGGNVAKQGDWIYYGLKDGLYKCKEDKTQKEKLFSIDKGGGVFNINVIDDWIYSGGWGVYRIKADGTDYEQIVSEDITGGTHFIGDKIYKGNEFRMKLDGTDIEQIYDKNVAYGYTLNIVDGWIYFYDSDSEGKDGLFKMKFDGSDLEMIFQGRSDVMIVDGDWIYFQNQKDNEYLYKMKTDGTEVQPFVRLHATSINAAGNWIYYNAEGNIYKIKTDGSGNQKLIDNSAGGLHILGDWIYYWGKGDGRDNLYRIKTDGTENQVFAIPGEIEIKENTEESTSHDIVKEGTVNYAALQNGDFSELAGTYRPLKEYDDLYGGGEPMSDLVLDKNGIITGGGAWFDPNPYPDTKPISVKKNEDGSYQCQVKYEDEEYQDYFLIYPKGAKMTNPYSENKPFLTETLYIQYMSFDGGVSDIIYYKVED